jgi:hypothetical protein
MHKKELAFVIFHLHKNTTSLGDWSHKKKLAWLFCHTHKRLAWGVLSCTKKTFLGYDKLPMSLFCV